MSTTNKNMKCLLPTPLYDDNRGSYMTGKNIIICVDGAESKCGCNQASNVYKLYKMIDRNFSGNSEDGNTIHTQIAFYDNEDES